MSGSPALYFRNLAFSIPGDVAVSLIPPGIAEQAEHGQFGPWTYVRSGDSYVELRTANGHYGIDYVGRQFAVVMGAGDDAAGAMDRLSKLATNLGFL